MMHATDVSIIDGGAVAIIVAHDNAARAVLRAKLGVYWVPVPWCDVHELVQPLVRMGFSVEYYAERRAVAR